MLSRYGGLVGRVAGRHPTPWPRPSIPMPSCSTSIPTRGSTLDRLLASVDFAPLTVVLSSKSV